MKAPPARPSREEVLAAYRRDVLLDAARRVFGARGFDEATVDAIAAEAKVAKGTVYLYFPSKLAIYEAAFAAGMDELTRLTDERVRAAGSIREAIRAFVEVRVAYFQAHPDDYRMYVHEVSRQLTDRTPRKSTCRDAMLAHTRGLREAFTHAMAAGAVRALESRGRGARRLRSHPRLRRPPAARAQPLERGAGNRLPHRADLGGPAARPRHLRTQRMTRPFFRLVAAGLIVAAAAGAAPAQEAGVPPTSPFRGSVPQGTAAAEPLRLTLGDTMDRALQFNLGLLLQEEAAQSARGARWRALSDLLPKVAGTLGQRRQVINLEAFGFPAPDPIVGPFNVFDARIGLSQPVDRPARLARPQGGRLRGARGAGQHPLGARAGGPGGGQPVSRSGHRRQPHRGGRGAAADRHGAADAGPGPEGLGTGGRHRRAAGRRRGADAAPAAGGRRERRGQGQTAAGPGDRPTARPGRDPRRRDPVRTAGRGDARGCAARRL